MESHPNTVNGSEWWASAGLMFHDTRMWVGQLKVVATTDVPQTYSDVSANMASFCPNMHRDYFYRPELVQRVARVRQRVDKLVGTGENDGSQSEIRKNDNDSDDMFQQIVTEVIERYREETRMNAKLKKETTSDDNEILKNETRDLLTLLMQTTRNVPVNHDLLSLLRENLGNMLELEGNEGLKTGSHDLLTLLRQNLGNPTEFEFLEDGRIRHDYEYLASTSSVFNPILLTFTLAVTLSHLLLFFFH